VEVMVAAPAEGEETLFNYPPSPLLPLFRRELDQAFISIRHARIEASDPATIIKIVGVLVTSAALAEGEGRVHVCLGLGLCGAGGNLGPPSRRLRPQSR